MKETVEYNEIKKLHAFKILKKHSLELLEETVKNFFSCKVELITSPKKEFRIKHNIDIHANISRGFYPVDENSVLILGRMFKDKQLISALGIRLSNIDVKRYTKLLNVFENLLSHHLTEELPKFFENTSLIVGDELLKQVITEYVSKGYYDSRQIRHLIEYFFKLRTTSFEGEYFSTGCIFTKSDDMLEGTRFGTTNSLTNPFYISTTNIINKRLWYLVDGKTSYLLGNKNLCFNNIFTLNEDYLDANFIDTHTLALTLKGGDFLIKIENEKLLSICVADGSEFIFFENQWRYRNYSALRTILSNKIKAEGKVLDSILFYVLNCSKKQYSTILWFPEDLDKIDPYINLETKNKFLKKDVNLTDKQAINHIFRCLSSDGASIIDNKGNLLYLGVIVDIQKAKVGGLTGTGESAASILGENGISIKVSADGLIKVFMKDKKEPIYF